MKTILKVTASLIVLAFTHASYAKAECPAGDELRQAKLIFADKWGDEWLMFSNPVTVSNGDQWTAVVEMKSDLKDANEALAAAQKQLAVNPLSVPTVKYREGDRVTECLYSSEHAHFLLGAVNPPTPMPRLA